MERPNAASNPLPDEALTAPLHPMLAMSSTQMEK